MELLSKQHPANFSHSNKAAFLGEKSSPFFQPKLTINQPNDEYEQEADAIAEKVMRMPDRSAGDQAFFGPVTSAVQRKCAHCEEENQLQRKETGSTADTANFQLDDYVSSLSGRGQSLSKETQGFFEPRLGYDFSSVKVHTDAVAARSAQSINALAFTSGNNIVFNNNQYSPDTDGGRKLLAHELTHVVQQNGSHEIVPQPKMADLADHNYTSVQKGNNSTLYRSAVSASDPIPRSETDYGNGRYKAPAPAPRTQAIPFAENCPPPPAMTCSPAVDSPSGIVNTLIFPQDSAVLNVAQQAEIDATAASWNISGKTAVVRVDGYASAEGACGHNWELSCRRARAVVAELMSPSDGTSGLSGGNIESFVHGETSESGISLTRNRMATISIPSTPAPPVPAPPSCALPVMLGSGSSSGRSCGSHDDFAHNDHPSISAASAAKLAGWARTRPFSRGPLRSMVTDLECELEMDTVLTLLAGSSGHDAYARFKAGTGGTMTLGPGTILGAMALSSASFLSTVTRVQTDIERQLATMASAGALNPCALSVKPLPPTFFSFSDGRELKSVIGGTQGEKLFMTGFKGDSALRTYTIDLRFLICDDFGVDESDLYFYGLFAFWVLQHERGATHYAPFINELDLPVTISGVF